MSRDPDTDKLIALIDERKEANNEIDKLRIEALGLAIDADILDEFPELRPWYSSARSQGLVRASSLSQPKSTGELDRIRIDINGLLSEIRRKELLVHKLSDEIRHRAS
ncbi:MAG TPA: hypothetical protein VMS08_04420 [Candidatus Saccharimonadia bacterium]|nr:hypothetical protein [Candidatus Saccharimonadia bacterium]